jgi:hypothetical protein
MTTQRPGRGGAATSGERAAARPLGAGGADHPDPGKRLRAAGDPARPGQRRRAERELVTAVDAVAPDLGATQACRALGISRATLYRRRRPPAPPASSPRDRGRRGRSASLSAKPSVPCCTRPGLSTWPRPRWSPPCSTRQLPRLGADHVPHPGRRRADRRATQPAHPPAPCPARAAGDPAQRAVELPTAPSCSARRPGPTRTST